MDVQWQRALKDAQRSAKWFEARKGRVTGSAVGAILGVDPHRSRDDVMRAMVRDYHGADSEFTGNIATDWGTDHEAIAIQDLEIRMRSKVKETGIFVRGWYAASPDGVMDIEGETVAIEVKCPFGIRKQNPPTFKGIDAESEQPHYYAQCQFEMKCLGLSKVVFWMWTPHGNEGYVIERDHKYIVELMPILHSFYQEYLSEIGNNDHLEPRRQVIESEAARKIVEQYDDVKSQLEIAKERLDELKRELIETCKGKNSIVCGKRLTLVESAGSVSYSKLVKDRLPDLTPEELDQYRGKKTTTWRIQ